MYVHMYAYVCSIFQYHVVKKITFIFLSELPMNTTENQLTIYLWLYFMSLCSISQSSCGICHAVSWVDRSRVWTPTSFFLIFLPKSILTILWHHYNFTKMIQPCCSFLSKIFMSGWNLHISIEVQQPAFNFSNDSIAIFYLIYNNLCITMHGVGVATLSLSLCARLYGFMSFQFGWMLYDFSS